VSPDVSSATRCNHTSTTRYFREAEKREEKNEEKKEENARLEASLGKKYRRNPVNFVFFARLL
jgi:hypothetical protein